MVFTSLTNSSKELNAALCFSSLSCVAYWTRLEKFSHLRCDELLCLPSVLLSSLSTAVVTSAAFALANSTKPVTMFPWAAAPCLASLTWRTLSLSLHLCQTPDSQSARIYVEYPTNNLHIVDFWYKCFHNDLVCQGELQRLDLLPHTVDLLLCGGLEIMPPGVQHRVQETVGVARRERCKHPGQLPQLYVHTNSCPLG